VIVRLIRFSAGFKTFFVTNHRKNRCLTILDKNISFYTYLSLFIDVYNEKVVQKGQTLLLIVYDKNVIYLSIISKYQYLTYNW